MAANAALRLIQHYEIDPSEVGFLGFGTESSTDNAVGAVVIKGMLDHALTELGGSPLPRSCEVPEYKHACLGGVYALKGAARWLACEGRGRKAIVVAADIAEYERGSTGEQTQGAGAVAMLLESDPKLFELDLGRAGSSAAYRGIDFRKPMIRHFVPGYAPETRRLHDFPVFNGKYSTACYVDAVVHALEDMFAKSETSREDFWKKVGAVMMHRPYQHMPLTALSAALVASWSLENGGDGVLAQLCLSADLSPDALRSELTTYRDLHALVRAGDPNSDPTPRLTAVAKRLREHPAFQAFIRDKMGLGKDHVRDFGNLYTASLPAWMAAAFDDAAIHGIELAGKQILGIGYGSGDAAEALPLRVVEGWQQAARQIRVAEALDPAIDLSREQYEALHDGRVVHGLAWEPHAEFVVSRVGSNTPAAVQDVGIEYYEYVR